MKKLLSIIGILLAIGIIICACGLDTTSSEPESYSNEDLITTYSSDEIDTEDTTTQDTTTEETTTSHSHIFADATCTSPKTCECGVTEGEALGHNWESPTCQKAKTCLSCGETEGEALDHNWEVATCQKAKTCLTCGATDGGALAHSWSNATCTSAKSCSSCGTISGQALGHNFVNGYCSRCSTKDPNYSSGPMVWIPTKTGKKYHSNPNCGNMSNPRQVPLSEAENLGYTPCKNCY